MSEQDHGMALLLILKGAKSELPQEEQEKVEALLEKMDQLLSNSGQAGQMAFSLFSARLASRSDDENTQFFGG